MVDGDTIQVCCIGWKREKVRYIGINTPETKHPTKEVEHFGEEASEANRKLVDGKTVRLEFDVQQLDKYGRTLGYVYLEDGTFVNAWLVENGYAMVMTVPPNVKHQELFFVPHPVSWTFLNTVTPPSEPGHRPALGPACDARAAR